MLNRRRRCQHVAASAVSLNSGACWDPAARHALLVGSYQAPLLSFPVLQCCLKSHRELTKLLEGALVSQPL